MTSGKTSDLTLDRFHPPLVCHFVNCDSIWRLETQRHLAEIRDEQNVPQIKWNQLPSTVDLDSRISPNAFAAIQIAPRSTSGDDHVPILRTIHNLYQKGVAVVVVADLQAKPHQLAFQAVGAVALITNVLECKKIASIIDRAAILTPPVFTSWRTRFVNRMPWSPVNGP